MEEIVEKIRARIAGVDPNGPRKLTGVFQLNIKTGEDTTKTITLDLNKLEVQDDNVHDAPDVTLDFDAETFAQVAQKELSFSDAVESGKATVTGDTALAESLVKVVGCQSIEQDSATE